MPESGGAPPTAAAGDGGRRRITARQRRRLEDAALSGIGRILASSRFLHGATTGRSLPDSDGLLAVAAGLYTYALEEYGKLLLVGRLPEKGGIISVPYRAIFRSHGKKFEAAREALPKGCWSAEAGIFDPRIFDPRIFDPRIFDPRIFDTRGSLEATFHSRTSSFYLDIEHSGDPVKPIPMKAGLLGSALSGMERTVKECEAYNRPTGLGGGGGGGARSG